MDSKQDSQVGVDLQYPRLGSLSLGRGIGGRRSDEGKAVTAKSTGQLGQTPPRPLLDQPSRRAIPTLSDPSAWCDV